LHGINISKEKRSEGLYLKDLSDNIIYVLNLKVQEICVLEGINHVGAAFRRDYETTFIDKKGFDGSSIVLTGLILKWCREI